MLITPDFSEVKDNVAPGIYKCRIMNAKLDQWEGKEGKPPTKYLNWELETFAEEDEKNNGRKIFHKTPLNGGGAFRLRDFYKAVMGEDLAGEFDAEMLYSRECEVTIVDGKNKAGELTGYTEVKTVKPVKAS